jgi:hypothetical protein
VCVPVLRDVSRFRRRPRIRGAATPVKQIITVFGCERGSKKNLFQNLNFAPESSPSAVASCWAHDGGRQSEDGALPSLQILPHTHILLARSPAARPFSHGIFRSDGAPASPSPPRPPQTCTRDGCFLQPQR